MAEVFHLDSRDGYVYDPVIKQFDTSFWKQTTGTSTISSNLLRNNAAAISSYLLHLYADVEFALTVPVKPTAGDVRQWGFKFPASVKLGAAYFDITDTAFTFKVIDNNGTTTSTTLTWIDGTYSATVTYFRFRWERDQIVVYINGTVVATINAPGTGTIPTGPLALRINNANADNMDLTYLRIREAAAII